MSTQTDTIRKALRRAANLQELNLNNYNDDDVASLNGSVIVLGVEAMDALAALSELDAQPSQTEDLEGQAQRFFMAWPNGDIPAMLAAFARSLAQPSAPTVDQMVDTVMNVRDWCEGANAGMPQHQHREYFRLNLTTDLTKLLTNP